MWPLELGKTITKLNGGFHFSRHLSRHVPNASEQKKMVTTIAALVSVFERNITVKESPSCSDGRRVTKNII